MVKINRKVEYSLMILKHMSENTKDQERFSARDMCEIYNIPFDTASKVLQILTKNSIVESVKGSNGGYSLTKNLKEIDYLFLTEIIEEKIQPKSCFEQNCELIHNCNISKPISNLNAYILNLFSKISIHDLLYKNISLGKSFTEENL